jgi:hypothetical protein
LDKSELNVIAKSWISLHHSKTNSKEYDENFWSFEKMSDYCRKNPEYAWKIIIEIYENNPGEKIISNVAAGPLEDLLVNNGNFVLKWVNQYCLNNADFVNVLKMVWRNEISEDIWNELDGLIKKYS